MEVTTVRRIDREIVRRVCIEHDYYTHGDCRAYDALLDSIPSEIDDKEFIRIAKDIYDHSDIDKICGSYGCDEETAMESILFNLYNASWTQVTVHKFEEGLLT